jgi:hypothetical protein
MTLRKRLAWWLVRVAHRLHDPQYTEAIVAVTASGNQIEIEVTGNDYGCGISAISGLRWNNDDNIHTAGEDGWGFVWRTP